MEEKDFELLSVLRETGSITRAAERLFMTQSALSKRVKAIERGLDIDLLIRSRQGIRFTPEGETVLAHSQAAAASLAAMRRSLEEMQDTICGTLNAGISINYSQYRLPDVLAAYHRDCPKVVLELTVGQSRHLYRQMLDGTLDIAVLRGEYQWDGPQFLLSQENICLVRDSAHRDVPLTEALYISRRTDTAQTAQITRWLHENGLNPRANGFCVDSVSTCLEMIRRGLGWSLLPEIALGGFDGAVTPCLFADGEPFIRRTHILCQREALKLPQVSSFMEALKAGR